MAQTVNLVAQMPPNAETHFRLFYYAAVFRISGYLRRLSRVANAPHESLARPYAFLHAYEDELRAFMPEGIEDAEATAWWPARIAEWEEGVRARLPLRELAKRPGIGYAEQLMLVLAGLVEEDVRLGSVFASLQEPLPSRRPCLGLLGALACEPGIAGGVADWWSVAHRLSDAGLLVAENTTAPRSDWVMRVPPRIWDAVRGCAWTTGAGGASGAGAECVIYPKREFPPLKKLVLDDALRERLCEVPAVLGRAQMGAVILRGMADSGRRRVLGSLARSLRRDLLFYDRRGLNAGTEDVWHLVGPLATLTGAFPVVAVDPAPGETIELPPLKGYDGPIGVLMRREGGVGGEAVERAITLNIPAPAAAHRETIWQRTLGPHAGGDLDTIVNRFLLPLGNVERAAAIATGYARLDRREEVTTADVQLACRSLNRQKLDTLAQRLEVGGGWDGLVVNEATFAELEELECRCRHRERLIAHLGAGFRNSMNCGVRALFNGPSGTGKTLAAKVLASVLSTDVYRVDLAAIVNKYIGETEKNLSGLLARAEELDVILLIDEGDSLMTGRTDVKSANDRYANLETNYLLQRLETYQGIIIVTTNAGNRIDQAFQRRFDVLIEFHPPDPRERLLIWRRHLPATHRAGHARLQEIAHQCALTGGQIRNAALHAALLAVDAGRGGEVNDSDLDMAVRREYRKAGASCPLRPPAHANGHQASLDRLLSEIH